MLNRFFMAVSAMAMVVASAEMCFARLGETEAELEARYGKPSKVVMQPKFVGPAEKTLHWNKQDTFVSVVIYRGRCVQHSVAFYDAGNNKVSVKQNLQKAMSLLEENAQGEEWSPRPEFAGNELLLVWERSDFKAIAYVTSKSPHELLIENTAFRKEVNK